MQKESSEENTKSEVNCDDTDIVKKIIREDENGNTERTSEATDDSETSTSIKTNDVITAIEIDTIKQQPNTKDINKSFIISETDQTSSIDMDSIGNNDEQFSSEIHKKSSNSDQVGTTIKSENKSDKERRVDEVAICEDDNKETESVDDKDGLRKVLKAIIPCSSGKYRPEDEENEPYGFEDEIKSRKKLSKIKSNILSDDHYKLLNSNENEDPVWKQKSSFKEAMTMPMKFEEKSDPKSNLSPRGSEGRNQGISSSQNLPNEKSGYPSQTNIQLHSPATYKPRDNKTQTIIDPDYYNFNHTERGHMVLIVNDRFRRQSFRDGSHWDLLKMREIARKFGFRLFNYEKDRNLTKPETMRLLREAQRTDHSNCDCFLFMISTHGLEQKNSMAKGKLDHALVCADDQLIFTSSILEMFNDKECPTLKNKPKFFFIQACRGEDLDHGSNVRVVKIKPVDKPCGVEVFSSEVSSSPATQRRKGRESSIDEYDVKFKYDASETNIETNRVSSPHSLPQPEAQFPQPGQSNTVSHAQGCVSAKGVVPVEPSVYKQTSEILLQNPSEPRSTPSFCTPKFTQPLHPSGPPHSTIQQPHHPYSRFMPSSPQFSPTKQVNKIYALMPYAIVDTPSLRCDNDMLVMYAIPQGMFAWRSTSDGSWMIDYLHQVLMAYDMRRPKSLLTLLTKVSSIMARRSTNTPSNPSLHEKKAIPVIEHKLIKDVIFTPKFGSSQWVKEKQANNVFAL